MIAVSLFNPSPLAAAAILADLDDCSLSFNDLARKHSTTAEALALWLSTDEIKDRIQATLDAMALRVRRVATGLLPAATRAICRIVDDYNAAARTPTVREGVPRPSDTATRDPFLQALATDLERQRRRDESIRRACAILLRLANFFSPTKPPPRRDPAAGSDCGAGFWLGSRRVEDSPWRDDQPASDSAINRTNLREVGTHPCPPTAPAPRHPSPDELIALLDRWQADHTSAHTDQAHQHPLHGHNNSKVQRTNTQSSSLSVPSLNSSPASVLSSSPAPALTSSPGPAIAEPRPPPFHTYQRPRQRFKARR